jgi:protein-disulfide isomerase
VLGNGEKIVSEYVNTGKLKLVYVAVLNHQRSAAATQGAFCAGEQGAFWRMHHRLYEGYNDLWGVSMANMPALLKQYAAELKLDTDQFNRCIDTQQTAKAVQASDTRYRALKRRGQPWFEYNGQIFSSLPWETWLEILNKGLK